MENTEKATETTTGEDSSLESSMMDLFNQATETVPQESAQQAEAAPEPTATTAAPESDGRARDESGKFVKKEAAAPPAATKEQEAQPQATEQHATEQTAPAEIPAGHALIGEKVMDLAVPLRSMSAGAKSVWKDLPESVRLDIYKREHDFHVGLKDYKESADFANNIRQVIRPFEQTLRQLNATPEQAVHELLKAEHLMRTLPPEQKTAYFYQLAQQYGVPLQQPQQAEQQYVDPTVQALQQQVSQLHSHLAQTQQFQQQQVAQQQRAADMQAQTELQTFAKDPKSMYLDNVREDMALLLQEGRAKDLQDAYDKACWQNPEIRQILLQQQIQASGNKRIEEAKQKAANAKRAGFDVVGQGSVVAGDRQLSLEEELMSRYNSTSN